MPDDIGQAIAGPPQDENVNKWKDFLTRPENLATALVLMAGITGPRARGQSKTNKLLTSGVGALGFRGGLEAGVEGQRAATRKEQRTVEAQDADIAAQQAATAQGKTRNEILQQQVEQQGQARPLAPSDITLNKAQAEEAHARAAALGQQPERDLSFPTLLATNLEAARDASVDGTIDENAVALQTLRQMEFNKLAEIGALTSQVGEDGIEVLGIDTAMIPPDRLQEFKHLVPEPSVEPAVEPAAATNEIANSLRVGGKFKASPQGQETTVRVLRKQGDFDELTDDAILDRVAEVRKLAQDKQQLDTAPLESLEEMLTVFGRMLTGKEARAIRVAINRRSGRSAAVIKGLETSF